MTHFCIVCLQGVFLVSILLSLVTIISAITTGEANSDPLLKNVEINFFYIYLYIWDSEVYL